VEEQPVFFVAPAPLAPDGHVNVSPKGLDTLAVLDPLTVAWLDLTGSGVETIAHLRDNGRITVMFCAFEGPPRILRLHGHARVLDLDDERAAPLLARFPDYPGRRAVITVAVERISTSCGYGVPLLEYRAERSTLVEWAQRKGPDGIADYHVAKNSYSIDGLPGVG
jgi:hypothetical protein